MLDRSMKANSLFVIFCLLLHSPLMAASMSTPTQVSVDRLGAANISIPVQVPPGTAGIAPSIGLTYNSQAGNGLLGVGGAIGGLSSITRCAKTKAQDGANGSVALGSDDAFCLDGQRLFAVSGAYGATGTEYRTEIANFSKIVSYAAISSCKITLDGSSGVCELRSPGWFKVWTKSGQMIEYGNTVDSNIQAQGSGGNVVAHTWAMNRVEDIKGNYLTVSYINDSANGEFYPSRIDYTGNSGTGQAPDNSVRFEYDTRPDLTNVYFGPALVRSSVRLRDVKTYAGNVMVRNYILTYTQSPATSYSRLATVTECQSDRTSCLPAVNMEWAEQAKGFTLQRWLTTVSKSGFVAGDIDGTGRTGFMGIWPPTPPNSPSMNFLYSDGTKFVRESAPILIEGTYSPATGSAVATGTSHGWFAANLQGTKRTDLINVLDNGSSLILASYVYSRWAANMGMGHGVAYTWAALPRNAGQQDKKFLVADFKGDDRDEVVSIFNDGGGKVAIDVFQKVVGSNQWQTSSTRTGSFASTGPYDAKQRWFAADVNGDGLADLVCVRNDGGSATIDVYLNNGRDFTYSTWETRAGGFWDSQQWFLADVNGDGRPDLVNVFGDGHYASADVHLNTGKGFSAQRWITQGASYNDPQKWNTAGAVKWFVGDVNGDGRADLINVYNDSGSASTIVLLSTGIGFSTETWEMRAGAYLDTNTWYLADVTGKGAVHLVNVFDDGNNLSIDAHIPDAGGDRITALASDLTGRTQIQYYVLSGGPLSQEFITGETVYDPADYGLSPSMYVVRSLKEPDGIGGTLTTKYQYNELVSDVGGRGLLGFRSRYDTNVEKKLVKKTNFGVTWPYTGIEIFTEVASGSTVFSATTNTLGCMTISGDICNVAPGVIYFPYVKQSSFNTYDLNGATSVSGSIIRTYDVWGNVTSLDVKKSLMGVEHRSVTTNAYTNDTANWRIGQLDRTSTTNSQ